MSITCFRFLISRPEDTARAFVRFECQLINFPAVDNTRELAEKYIVGTNANVYFICPNSYNYSGNIIHLINYQINLILQTLDSVTMK